MESNLMAGWDMYMSCPAYMCKEDILHQLRYLKDVLGFSSVNAHRLRYSKHVYPGPKEVIGNPDVMLIKVRSNGWLGRGSYLELQYAKNNNIPVVFQTEGTKKFKAYSSSIIGAINEENFKQTCYIDMNMVSVANSMYEAFEQIKPRYSYSRVQAAEQRMKDLEVVDIAALPSGMSVEEWIWHRSYLKEDKANYYYLL